MDHSVAGSYIGLVNPYLETDRFLFDDAFIRRCSPEDLLSIGRGDTRRLSTSRVRRLLTLLIAEWLTDDQALAIAGIIQGYFSKRFTRGLLRVVRDQGQRRARREMAYMAVHLNPDSRIIDTLGRISEDPCFSRELRLSTVTALITNCSHRRALSALIFHLEHEDEEFAALALTGIPPLLLGFLISSQPRVRVACQRLEARNEKVSAHLATVSGWIKAGEQCLTADNELRAGVVRRLLIQASRICYRWPAALQLN